MTSRLTISPSSSNIRNPWMLLLFTAAIWVVVALFGVYWTMKFVKSGNVSASIAMIVPQASVDSSALGKLLGVDPLAGNNSLSTESSVNLALFGVASTSAGGGIALISTDGKPAKPYRIGGKVTDTLTLKSVSRTEVKLATANSETEVISLAIQARLAATGVNPRLNMPAMPSPNVPRFPLQQYNPQSSSAATPTMPSNMPPDASRALEPNTPNSVSATTSRVVGKIAPRESNTTTVGANGQIEERNSIPATERLSGAMQEAPIPSLK